MSVICWPMIGGSITSSYRTTHSEGTFLDSNGVLLHHSVFNLDWVDWEPKVICDVGAYNMGDSIRFKNRWPKCAVHAFELSPQVYGKHAPYAISQGINTHNVGVSDYNGRAKYWQSRHVDGVNAQSTLIEPSQAYKNAYSSIVSHSLADEVDIVRLDDFCKEKGIGEIDILHVDAENSEWYVINGLGKLRPKMIFAEFLIDGGGEHSKSFQETLSLLDGFGYDCVGEFSFDRLFLLRE